MFQGFLSAFSFSSVSYLEDVLFEVGVTSDVAAVVFCALTVS